MHKAACVWLSVLAAAGLAVGSAQAGAASITLYSSENYKGISVTLAGAVPNLDDYYFNARARSVRVKGEWLMCAGKYFASDCIQIDRDIPDLKPFGMKQRAVSVRPRIRFD
jgi:Beta/Gamma crystallin